MKIDKIRIRSKYELKIRKKEFLQICEILDKLKIKYFLMTGILLGAVRDKNFIAWDWDVEISVFNQQFEKKFLQISKELEKKFKIISKNYKKDNYKINFIGVLDKSVTNYTIEGWSYSKKRKIFWRNYYEIPAYFLKTFSKVKLFGKNFNCPNNPEKFLEFTYGNWKIPLKTFDKDKYLTTNIVNKKNYYLIKFKNFFKKLIYKLVSKLNLFTK